MKPVLITGGAGFIGANLADRLASAGQPVLLFDNLSRRSVERNLVWLNERHGSLIDAEQLDVRDALSVRRAVEHAREVFHFAAQVAVTHSLARPDEDFEINARGTLHVLEALRAQPSPPPLVFTSTNKVYGPLAELTLDETSTRYVPADPLLSIRGLGEERALDFHGPFSCSKGAADQYVLDYARSFGLPAVVLRLGSVYGPRQFGNADQGFLSHFLREALLGHPITLFGDGRQVRDVLYVDDLVDALLLAQKRMAWLAGRAFNIGGGADHTLSLLELLRACERITGRAPEVLFAARRPGDQRYWVSDTRRFERATGWRPRIDVGEGLDRLHRWLAETLAARDAPFVEQASS
jgi:CDP-paratose 2-epimerase